MAYVELAVQGQADHEVFAGVCGACGTGGAGGPVSAMLINSILFSTVL